MLPVFLTLKNMGLINTYFAIIIPGMASIFGIFLKRHFAMSIPDSLTDSSMYTMPVALANLMGSAKG